MEFFSPTRDSRKIARLEMSTPALEKCNPASSIEKFKHISQSN